jgi:leader peptidase (prepilin peptidase)/N-methyltransferase
MQLIQLLQTNSVFFFIIIGLLGLVIGSFLNVVIHRLPIMMQNTWRHQCEEFLHPGSEGATPVEPKHEPFNLVVPRSRCPHCGHMISASENIPVISYLVLKGKCSNCGHKISPRYPIIEAVTAILSVIVAWQLGFSWATAAGLLLTWALIALSMIDFDHQLLPDSITLPFLWLGVGIAMFNVFCDLPTSVIGAMAGYLILWSVFWAFKLLTGKEGMGYGDFKLLSMFGAWLGWQNLPVIILLSSFVGAVVGISLIVFRGRDKNIPIPFGPYIATAGWISMLWGDDLIDLYLHFAGIA